MPAIPTAAVALFLAHLSPQTVAAEGPRADRNPSPDSARVWIDPNSGAITGTRPEGATVPPLSSKAATRDGEDLVAFELPSGGRGLYLAGRFRHAAVATVGADGAIRWDCVDHAAHAEPVTEAESSPSPAEDR